MKIIYINLFVLLFSLIFQMANAKVISKHPHAKALVQKAAKVEKDAQEDSANQETQEETPKVTFGSNEGLEVQLVEANQQANQQGNANNNESAVKEEPTKNLQVTEENAPLKADAELKAVANVAQPSAPNSAQNSKTKINNMNAEAETPVFTKAGEQSLQNSNSTHKMLLSLTIILVMLGAGYFAFRRMFKSRIQASQSNQIKLLTQFHIAPKKTLAVVRVAGESMLIGITEQNITMLKSLSLLDEDIPEPLNESFSGALKQFNHTAADESEKDEFAIGKIKDVVNKRLRGMKEI